jgi:hypothetical protein
MQPPNPNEPGIRPEAQRSLLGGVLAKLDAVHQVRTTAMVLFIFFGMIYFCWREKFWQDPVTRFTCPFFSFCIGAYLFLSFREPVRRAWPKLKAFLK